MVGAMSFTWWNCGRGVLSGLMRLGQEIDHGIAGAAEMRGDQLRILERRVARPGPAGVVHVVGLRSAQRVQTAELLQRGELLLDVLGMSFWASSSLMVPFWPSALAPLSPKM